MTGTEKCFVFKKKQTVYFGIIFKLLDSLAFRYNIRNKTSNNELQL